MKCDGCSIEMSSKLIQPVTVIWNAKPICFDYCKDCIKSDLQKGFVVLNEENRQFIYEPEKFYLSEETYQT